MKDSINLESRFKHTFVLFLFTISATSVAKPEVVVVFTFIGLFYFYDLFVYDICPLSS